MGELDVVLKGKSLGDYTNTQLRMALGAVLYTNTADMWDKYLKSLGYSGSVSAMLEKYYVDYAIPSQFRNYINAGAAINNPQNLFTATDQGFVYDNNDYVNPASWRRNLFTYTEQFDNAYWSKNAGAISANATTAPDGTSTADKLVATAIASQHWIYKTSISVLNGQQYVFSCYFKQAEYRYVQLRIITSSTVAAVGFDLQTESVYTTALGSGRITSVGDGWYRCDVLGTADSSSANVYVNVNSSAILSNTFTGDGTSGVYVWGAQLEAGSVATDYQRITDFNSDFLAAYPNTTMFVDSAGTTPATVNGLVGLQLDKSASLSLGADIITNGDFASDTWWLKSNASVTIAGGAGVYTTAANGSHMYKTGILTVGKLYRITWEIKTISAGGLLIQDGVSASPTRSSVGVYSETILATASTFYITSVGASTTATIDNVVVREIAGNHRYQTTTGSKPILRGTPIGSNLVTNGDFASGTTGWSGANGGTLASPSSNIEVTNGAASQGRATQSFATSIGNTYRIECLARCGTATSALVGWGTAFGSVGGGTASTASTSNVLLQIYFVATATTTHISVGVNTTTIGHTALFDNVTVHDVSADAVTAPYGLQYDGIDDFLTTASVDFTATDKMAVVMGVRKLSDVARASLAMAGTSTANNGWWQFRTPTGTGNNDYGFNTRGTVEVALATGGTYASPVTSVLTGTIDIAAPSGVIRVNGAVINSNTTSRGTGNFGNHALFFGRVNGATDPFNGLDFGGVCIGKTLTATQLANVEKWVAIRTGVSL